MTLCVAPIDAIFSYVPVSARTRHTKEKFMGKGGNTDVHVNLVPKRSSESAQKKLLICKVTNL